jgi:hypothetical protein
MACRCALTRPLVVASAILGFCGASAAGGPLPRLAVSLPAAVSPEDAARTLQACGSPDVLVLLPPVSGAVGGSEEAAGAPDAPRGALPTGVRFYARLLVNISDVTLTGRDREGLIERQAGDLIGRLALTRPGVTGLVLEPRSAGAPAEVLQFALETLAIKARGARPGLEITLVLDQDLAAGGPGKILAYVDSVVAEVGQSVPEAQGKPLILRTAGLTSGAAGWLDALMAGNAARAEMLWVQTEDLGALRRLCASVLFVSRSLGGEFEMTVPERAPLAVMVGGHPASPAVAFVSSRSADVAVLLKAGGSRQAPTPLSLAAAGEKTPQVTCFDAVDGRVLDARTAAGQAPGCRGDAEYVLFRARTAASGDRVFESVNVTARAGLRVEEIIARWQAAREAERQALDNYSAPCFLSLHFEITALTTSFDVALELQQFVDRTGVQDWVQTAFRVNGVKLRKGQEFPLPQIEPDKIVTKPLDLRLDEKYVYELLGIETVRNRMCYVVGIKPAMASADLYSGKIWIDGVDFTQVRLRLEQRDGKNNVASHVETQEFEPIKDAQGRAFTLVRSIYAEDSVNLAGRSITVEKRYRFGNYAINSADFGARLASARASDDPMFRDTEAGLRALRKKGTERVVEPEVGKRVFALVGGVLYNGSYSFPIPLAGVSWVDFDWHKTGTQLSAFFAGPIFVANLSRQVNKNLRWGVDLSLIALPSTFYEYADNQEVKAKEVRNFEQYGGGLLNWQATPELDLSTQAELYYDTYQATSYTDPRYRLPASGVTFDLYGEAKYVRKSFSAIATIDQAHRFGWREFGYPDSPDPLLPDWTRYSVEVSQHVFVGKLTRGGISAGYFGGRDLDRFSEYSPQFFSRPTLHGIPTGVDSFDEVTSLSGYYGFNVADLAKLEGYYTHAWTRNRFEGDALRQFDGLDYSIGVAGPFGTFVQGSISFAIRGNLERYNSRWGTYLVFLKPLKK